MRPFGFEVQQVPDGDPSDPPVWAVDLPHQCDSWSITEWGVSHAAAVAELERFVAEATDALTALREHREYRQGGAV